MNDVAGILLQIKVLAKLILDMVTMTLHKKSGNHQNSCSSSWGEHECLNGFMAVHPALSKIASSVTYTVFLHHDEHGNIDLNRAVNTK